MKFAKKVGKERFCVLGYSRNPHANFKIVS